MPPARVAPRPPMTATQKLLLHKARLADRANLAHIKAGDVVRVPVDWVLASELALNGMLVTHRKIGEPKLARPDRFALAVDHTVSPWRSPEDHTPTGQKLTRLAEAFNTTHGLTHYFPANDTILHTRPYLELFRPGDIIFGADSHSIMHGGLGTFSIGLGGADVMMAAVLGAALVKVPEAIQISLNGALPFLLTGKDIILGLLRVFRKNTVAMERTVEYWGHGLKHLSASDRGTICNMGAEFGAMTSFVPADEVIARFMATRDGEFAEAGLYFAPDEQAPYVRQLDFNLDTLTPQVALHGSPDNVHPVADMAGTEFQTAFIGSCTPTIEEFVLAAFVTQAALDAGVQPRAAGERARLLAPSSMGIARMLQRFDLIRPFQEMGYQIGAAGCSLCLGIDGDGAKAGQMTLGTHNRTFENRTGVGAMSMATSAATVAASAATMRVTDPRNLEPHLAPHRERLDHILAELRGTELEIPEVRRTEPELVTSTAQGGPNSQSSLNLPEVRAAGVIQSRAITFGDGVDTDAMIAGEYCHLTTLEELGRHAFDRASKLGWRPGEFHAHVQAGHKVVLAGQGWASGSSREHAEWAMIGAGVEVVVAESIGFIHYRNMVNENLPFRLVHPEDQAAYRRFKDGTEGSVGANGQELIVDLDSNVLNNADGTVIIRLIPIHEVEEAMQQLGGLAAIYAQFGEDCLEAALEMAAKIRTARKAA
jgi:homoaconitase/3-isopropylmalate dehydratase large subunit/3-isopropylmalate dehydratase small subunit